MVAVADMIPHPDNPRDDLGSPQELAELANDLAANGNTIRVRLFPITTGPDAGKYLIIEGHRRREAAKLGNVPELEAWIDPSCDTKAKQIEEMLRENTHRVGITASNEAKAIQTLLDCEGMNVRKVAKAIHRSESFIRQRSRLAHMPPVAHQLVDGGGLTLEQSEAFDEFKDDPDATQALTLVATNPRMNRWDWDREVLRCRTRRDAPAKAAQAAKVIEETGALVITEGQADSGHYDRDYSADKLSTEEHVAQGHYAHVSGHDGELRWYKRSETALARKPLTDEEREAKRRLKDISAGLEQDLALWDEHLRASLTDAGGGLPLTAAEVRLQAGLASGLLEHSGHYQRAGELLLNKDNSLGLGAELREAVNKLRPLQLVMLRVELKLKPDNLHRPATWDTKPSHWKGEETEINRWIRVREEVFGYGPAVFEKEAIEHFKTQALTSDQKDADDE
ncbi:ParB N-terminal domain-containing protein [Pseudarthrobacter equi]|uniref:ParB N-terminal domain-containing protein n=1 Tax=Pseudarthrobacter equi TaxID=728066 RepID=UPI0021C05D93|nr:ParB N-terminal domain-containing protein [Pseudarthrobacter equi]MCT9624309.1 ParB N-terminal domain-containing protein [Pseudarthrobacter equi]